MRLLNPANDATIIGEAGDNIGRGGRTSMFFVDEAAYLERPALIEAALTATTDVRIDISTPCNGSLFNEWASREQRPSSSSTSPMCLAHGRLGQGQARELEGKGLKHVFAQEFLRDGTAGLEGQLIPGEWVETAVDAASKLGIKPTGEKVAGARRRRWWQGQQRAAVRYGVEVQFVKSRCDLLADGAGAWAYAIATQSGCQRLCTTTSGLAPALRLR